MTRVAFIEQESRMGGVEMSTLYLIQCLQETDFESLVLLPDDGPLADACNQAKIPIDFYKKPDFRSASFGLNGQAIADPLALLVNPAKFWHAARPLQKIIEAGGVDLVVTKGLLAHLYGGLAARRQRLPCIWHVQDEIPTRRAYGSYLRLMQMASIKLAKAVVGDAQSITAQFAGHPNSVTVYNGIDCRTFKPAGDPGSLREELGIPNEAVVIGNMARLKKWKGQHVLIDAFNSLVERYPDLHLVLIGSPLFAHNAYEYSLRQQAAASCAPERIHFAGYRIDTAQSLAALNIYVHPSLRKDTAPLALLSAMATGLPIIISAVPGMLEVVEPGRDALVFSPEDPRLLAGEICKLLEDKGLRVELGGAARLAAVSRFSLETYTKTMLTVFETVLAQGKD